MSATTDGFTKATVEAVFPDLAYEAGLQGRDAPYDWTRLGHLARAYLEGVAERERRWGTLRDRVDTYIEGR